MNRLVAAVVAVAVMAGIVVAGEKKTLTLVKN